MQLNAKRAVVTGASSGIGQAIAIAFAQAGATVVVNYRNSHASAEQCVGRIENFGGKAKALRADVANRQDIEKLVDAAQTYLGGIDIWVNAAGADILTGSGATVSDDEKLSRLIAVDLQGTIGCCWAVAPALREAAQVGSIINISWDLALRGMPGRNPEMFAAVKAGITGFTRAYARSVAPDIRVNEIAPGWIATGFAETEMDADYKRNVIESTPMARFGKPEDVAQAAVYLASDAAAFVTGQTLNVNGGLVS